MPIVRFEFIADHEQTYAIPAIVEGRRETRFIGRGNKIRSVYTESQFENSISDLEQVARHGHVTIKLIEEETSDVVGTVRWIKDHSPMLYGHLCTSLSDAVKKEAEAPLPAPTGSKAKWHETLGGRIVIGVLIILIGAILLSLMGLSG